MAITIRRKGEPSQVIAPTEAGQLSQVGSAPTPVARIEPEPPKSVYTVVPVGAKVRITTEIYTWVKHFKPKDVGLVVMVCPPNTVHEDVDKYRGYVLSITEPTDVGRKGQRCMLFRHEFEVLPVA